MRCGIRVSRRKPVTAWLIPFCIPLLLAPAACGQQLNTFTEKLDRLVPQLLEKYDVPGTAVALARKGEVVWAEGYGLADEKSLRPVTRATVFQAASISKSVTAWGALKLVEQGKLQLDAPAEKYLTRWHLPNSEFDSDGVTIRRLLSHTAGLSLSGYPGFEPEKPLPSVEESLSGKTNGVGGVRIEREPGSQWSYSGGGYTLLQLIIEEASGKRFVDFMQEEVLEPLGMRNSSFDWTHKLKPATATAYRRRGQPLPNYLFTARAAAGLYTTAEDLARFVAAAMPGPAKKLAGRGVVNPESVEAMFTPAAETRPGSGIHYGLGYGIQTLPNGVRAVGHSGGNRGWKLRFALLPGKKEGIVVLTNSDTGARLYQEVLCAWFEWAAGAQPKDCR